MEAKMLTTQQKRTIWRSAFFLLFLFAPPLDIFRFDLTQTHFIFFGEPWELGVDKFHTGEITSSDLISNLIWMFFIPIGLTVVVGIIISWKWGRLYCGWLCPHFSVVEIINSLMRRASGKLSIWDKKIIPEHQQDGTKIKTHKNWWILTYASILFFSLLWSVVLLTYLLPPTKIYGNLFNGTLTTNQSIFIAVGTFLLFIEFTFARHLFCRFGCAIGVFQSLVWMGNKKAMVVSFDRKNAKECADCDVSCEHACPMRLKPRSAKRHMFTCTQCMQCVEACENVQSNKTGMPLLKMLEDQCAIDTSSRDFGNKPDVPAECYEVEFRNKRCCTK